MYIILIALLISEAALIGSSSSCEEPSELENTCGKYCFKIVKPVLEQTAILQKQVASHEDRQNADTQAKLEDFGKQLTLSHEKVADVQPKFIKIEEQLVGLQSKFDDIQTKYNNITSQLLVLQEKVAQQEGKLQVIERKRKDHPSHFTKIGSKYYYIEDRHKMSWFAAAYECQQRGGHLASIQNEREYGAIKAKLNHNHNYWLDVNDLYKEGLYISLTTGRKAPYLIWYVAQPDNKGCSDKLSSNNDCCKGRRTHQHP
ncbi:uncharacterized protein Dvir_GJ16497 [Drosophila virilis]|uniref:C-type lectin domain-containing protein n=1 Tax=Drosophila virilis TaxID=7244 RepID=B4LSM9_DROVI|nr:uncharacterized protein Dvir_GJ16497 [Drosophila virilis]